jgi:DNA primase
MRNLLLRHADAPDIHDQILAQAPAALDVLMSQPHVRNAPAVRNREDAEFAALCLAGDLAKLETSRSARREIAEAQDDITGLSDEGLTWRLHKAAEARNAAEKIATDDTNDLGEDRAALSNHLQRLIDGRIWEKKR